jgi:hypothetical protein
MYIVICSKKNCQIGNDYNNVQSAEKAAQQQKKKCKCSCCGIMSKESYNKSIK